MEREGTHKAPFLAKELLATDRYQKRKNVFLYVHDCLTVLQWTATNSKVEYDQKILYKILKELMKVNKIFTHQSSSTSLSATVSPL